MCVLILFIGTLLATAVVQKNYTEDFENVSIVGHDWAPQNWKHEVDSLWYDTTRPATYVQYDIIPGGGADGGAFIQCARQSVTDGTFSKDLKDLLVTPEVSGKVSFALKKQANLNAYDVTLYNYETGKEIPLPSDYTLTAEWNEVELNFEDPVRIGFRLNGCAIDAFKAENAEVLPKIAATVSAESELKNDTILTADADGMVELDAVAYVANIGNVAIDDCEVLFATVLGNDTTILATKTIESEIAPMAKSEGLALKGKYTLSNLEKAEIVTLIAQETISNTTCVVAENVVIRPKLPIIELVNEQGDLLESIDFGTFSGVTTTTFGISNIGADDLVVNTIELPEWITCDKTEAFSVKPNETTNVTLTASGMDGEHTGEMKIYSNAGNVIVGVKGEIVTPVLHNMSIDDFIVPTTATVNRPLVTSITITNKNTIDEKAEDYGIALMANCERVAFAQSVDIPAGESVTLTVSYVPTIPTETEIYATLMTADGMFDAYSKSVVCNIENEKSDFTYTIGTATTTSENVPLHLYAKNSMSEFIYTADMLNIPDKQPLTSIAFTMNSGSKNLREHRVAVYVANTTAETVDNSSAPDLNAMTCVFDEKVSFKGSETAEALKLNFNEPFIYEGKSLRFVVLHEGALEYGHFPFAAFAAEGAARVKQADDATEYASAQFKVVNVLPTAVIESVIPAPIVSGVIKDKQTGGVIADAQITYKATSGTAYTTRSNNDGEYSLKIYQTDNIYTVSIRANGYEFTSIPDVTVSTEDATVDYELQRAKIDVPFTVTTTTGDVLEGVSAYLYNRDLDILYGPEKINARGGLWFDSVYTGVCELQIDATPLGYELFKEEYDVKDLNFFTATLKERVVTPHDLTCTISHDVFTNQHDVVLDWNNGDAPLPHERFCILLNGESVDTVAEPHYVIEQIPAGSNVIEIQAIYRVEKSERQSSVVEIPSESAYRRITFLASTDGGDSPEGIELQLTNSDGSITINHTFDALGTFVVPYLPMEGYSIRMNREFYDEYIGTVESLMFNIVVEATLHETRLAPTDLTSSVVAEGGESTVYLNWQENAELAELRSAERVHYRVVITGDEIEDVVIDNIDDITASHWGLPVGNYTASLYAVYTSGETEALTNNFTIVVAGVDKVNADSTKVKVFAAEGSINIVGTDSIANIYTLDGTLVAQGRGNVSVAKGTYLVRVDGVSVKVSVR